MVIVQLLREERYVSKRNKKLNIYNYERSKRNYYKRGNKVSVI